MRKRCVLLTRQSMPSMRQRASAGALANVTAHTACSGMGIRMGAKRTRLYGLNLSRCLGDKFLKDEDLGLSAAPHVSPPLRPNPAAPSLVLLASDGLWDVTDPAAAFAVRAPLPLCMNE